MEEQRKIIRLLANLKWTQIIALCSIVWTMLPVWVIYVFITDDELRLSLLRATQPRGEESYAGVVTSGTNTCTLFKDPEGLARLSVFVTIDNHVFTVSTYSQVTEDDYGDECRRLHNLAIQ